MSARRLARCGETGARDVGSVHTCLSPSEPLVFLSANEVCPVTVGPALWFGLRASGTSSPTKFRPLFEVKTEVGPVPFWLFYFGIWIVIRFANWWMGYTVLIQFLRNGKELTPFPGSVSGDSEAKKVAPENRFLHWPPVAPTCTCHLVYFPPLQRLDSCTLHLIWHVSKGPLPLLCLKLWLSQSLSFYPPSANLFLGLGSSCFGVMDGEGGIPGFSPKTFSAVVHRIRTVTVLIFTAYNSW